MFHGRSFDWEPVYADEGGYERLCCFRTYDDDDNCYEAYVLYSAIDAYYEDEPTGMGSAAYSDEDCRNFIESFSYIPIHDGSARFQTPSEIYDPYWDDDRQLWVCETDVPWTFEFTQHLQLHRGYHEPGELELRHFEDNLPNLEACEEVILGY